MSHPGFGQLWQQAGLSDILLIVSRDGASLHAKGTVQWHPSNCCLQAAAEAIALRQFPGHKLFLGSSRYFAGRVQRIMQHIM
jgi:hypothetical protein